MGIERLTRLEKMAVRYLEQKTREKHFSFLVKDNLKSPPLALLQPRANLRAKEHETVDIAFNEQQKLNALEEISVE